MNCQQSRDFAVEFSRRLTAETIPEQVAAHLAHCAECARFLDSQTAFTSLFAGIAADAAAKPGPAFLETRLLAELEHAVHPRPWVALWRPVVGAALAVLIAVFALLYSPAPEIVRSSVPNEPFVAIPYVAPPAPYERTEILTMDLPVSALAAAGLDVHLSDTGAVVHADVMVGQDGRALAVRLPRSI